MSAEERVIFDEVKAALATEQREHWNTQMRLSALQDEVAEERRLNNASLKPSQCVAAEDTQPTDTDLTRARARTKVLKRENAELTQIIETLELVEVALRTDVSRLEGYKTKLEKSNTRLKGVLGISELTLCAVRNEHKILQDSAKTQANFMEQVDAACKIAEAKVQEQRKEIAALTINADRCAICESTQMEEITNRDAVILQYEIRAEDREEIIKAL
ncbi:MAG: hypothetical protein KAJ03_06310, partial [Gammaproteobacteria bacterium]|nr:hypothetical protein [Gammaproteobacteria bacterium]